MEKINELEQFIDKHTREAKYPKDIERGNKISYGYVAKEKPDAKEFITLINSAFDNNNPLDGKEHTQRDISENFARSEPEKSLNYAARLIALAEILELGKIDQPADKRMRQWLAENNKPQNEVTEKEFQDKFFSDRSFAAEMNHEIKAGNIGFIADTQKISHLTSKPDNDITGGSQSPLISNRHPRIC